MDWNSEFIAAFNKGASLAHDTAVKKGFCDPTETTTDITALINTEMMALVHTEISEAVEALRHGNPPDDKIPDFSGVEAELADAVIRIMHMAARRNWRIGEAIVAKMAYNENRPYKHGKLF